MRIGYGYDVHKLSENRKLILGGCRINYEKGLLGYSDADVLCHAVIDSILGAAGLKDIGKLYPDNDISFKDASSLNLLQMVHEKIKEKGYKIINIDSTIVAQKPLLSKYTDLMEQNIAEVCKIDVSQVNVKATTEEGLGFTGNLEGISAHSVCLLGN